MVIDEYQYLDRSNQNVQWVKIICNLAPKLTKAINNRPSHVPCPIHGGKDGLRCFDDFAQSGGMICNTCGPFPNGYLVLAWALDLPMHSVSERVRQSLAQRYVPSKDNVIHLPSAMSQPIVDAQAQYQIRETLAESLLLTHQLAEPARNYFYNRGIIFESSSERALHVDNLFFHQFLTYPSRRPAAYPALVASIMRDGEVVGLHKTFLTEGGEKARGGDSRRIGPVIYRGATTGGAIPLLPAEVEMAVAEGIESSLAVYEESGMAVWAATSAGGLAAMEIPDFVRTVIVFADNDVSGVGQDAAERLANRLRRAGKRVKVYIPERPQGVHSKSFDVLDHLLAGRRYGLH